MELKINGQEIAIYPSSYQISIMDLDYADGTYRDAAGGYHRDRVATKRQIIMKFPAMTTETLSKLLKSMKNESFQFTFFDPEEVGYITREFYVGDRKPSVAIIRSGIWYWENLELTITEF